jgi:hypothetical protein
MIDFNDQEGIRKALLTYYKQFRKGERKSSAAPASYSRENLTRDLATLFDTVKEKG